MRATRPQLTVRLGRPFRRADCLFRHQIDTYEYLRKRGWAGQELPKLSYEYTV